MTVAWRDVHGFSLVEMLVTMTVTLIVMAGSFQAFNDARRTAETGVLIADGSQNLRSAVNQLTRDLLQAGRELPNAGIPIPSGFGSLPIQRPNPPGTAPAFPTAWAVLPSVCPGSGLGPAVSGVETDVVTVLFGDPTLDLNEWPLTSILADGSRMTVDNRTQIGGATNGLRTGDLIWFSNGLGNAIQTVTRVEGQLVYFDENHPADAYHMNQRGAAQGTIMQIRGGQTFPPTSATRVLMVSYYLDTATAPGQLRLVRRVGFGPARVVGMGIENLQATYDIVDGTTNPTNQPDVVAPNTPSQVRKINLFLMTRSEALASLNRQTLRSGVATQVSLRSMSFVDRYQ
jgi:prepilin-type N-terminal cleavage/methylation domain-containing protein